MNRYSITAILLLALTASSTRAQQPDSSYAQPPPASKDRATGYLRGGKEVPGKYHIYPEQAAAGLCTKFNRDF
jgi:hypothetical protein